eukprot:sb/3466892/
MKSMELNIAELISELESELDGAMCDVKTREREIKHEITSHDEVIKKPTQVPVAVVKPETRSKLPENHGNKELKQHSNTVSHQDSDITELKHPVSNKTIYSTSATEFLKESSRHHHDDNPHPPPRLSPNNPFYENFPVVETPTESRTLETPTESRTPETFSESKTPAASQSSNPKNTTYSSSEPIMLTSDRTISHSTSSHRPSSGVTSLSQVTSSSGKRRKTTGSSSSPNVQLHQIPRTNLFIYNGSVISLQSLLNKLNSDGCHGNIPARPMTSLQQKHNAAAGLPSNNRLLDLVSRGAVDSTAVNEMTLGKCCLIAGV